MNDIGYCKIHPDRDGVVTLGCPGLEWNGEPACRECLTWALRWTMDQILERDSIEDSCLW